MDSSITPPNPSYLPFQYLKLDVPHQIRLLQVFRDEETPDQIRCKLVPACLDNMTCQYDAVSYCWGDPTMSHWIRLPNNRYLLITKSVASILRFRVTSETTGHIWIDGLCIDQNDTKEKAQQVRLMGRIFASANTVTAWVGDPSHDSREAIQFIKTLYSTIQNLFRTNEPVTMETISRSPHCDFPSSHWAALVNLVDRPWFRRMWIIQEIVVATKPRILCGESSIEWEALAGVVAVLQSRGLSHLFITSETEPPRISFGVKGIQRTLSIRYLRESNTPPTLLMNLFECVIYDAMDPRDKLYALLSISSEASDSDFDPDYSASPETIFTKATRRLLTRQNGSLDVLHAAGIGWGPPVPGLPSWVADWGSITPRTFFGQIAPIAGYRASGTSTTAINILFDPAANSITLTARCIDTQQ